VAWFKVDDGFYSSRKVTLIPRSKRWAAIGLWTLAGTWCAKELTDGVLPDYQFEELGGRTEDADELITAGLWERVPNGYRFLKWGEYQPTKAEVEESRVREAERKKRWRETQMSHRTRRGTDAGQDVGHQRVSGHPDPTRPDPTSTTSNEVVERPRTRGSRISEHWLPSPESVAKIKTECPTVDPQAEHSAFIDYWIAQPGSKGVKLDWDATWRNWMRRKQSDRKGKPTPTERARQTLQLATDIDMRELTA